MEEANGVGDSVLHKHALSVASDELYEGSGIVGQKDSRLVVPQVLDVELSEELAMDEDFLFVYLGCLEFACRHIQSDPAPGGGRQLGNLFEHGGGSSSKGDKGDAHAVQSRQVFQGGQAGVEDQVGGELAMSLLPKGNEAKDLLGFFSLSDIGVGIAESASFGIVCEKDQDAGLPPASSRDIVALYHRVLPVVGNRMEIQVKGVAGQEAVPVELLVPEGKDPQCCLALNRAGVLGKVALLRRYIQSGKKCQTLIGYQRHDMTLSLNGPELEGKTGAQGVGGRNHPRSGQMSGSSQMIEVQINQIRNKEEETSKAGGELAGRQREVANVSNGFYGRSGIVWSLLVQTPWQGSESFFMQDLTDSSGTEPDAGILQDFADLVDRVVFLSQIDDSVPGRSLPGLGRRTTSRRGKEAGMGIATEMMAKHSEGLWRVSELGGHHVGGLVFDEIGPQGLILPLLGVRRFEEKPPALC